MACAKLNPESTEPSIRLQNVRFKWSQDVYIDVGNMTVRAVPIRDSTVVFDRLDSFVLIDLGEDGKLVILSPGKG